MFFILKTGIFNCSVTKKYFRISTETLKELLKNDVIFYNMNQT